MEASSETVQRLMETGLVAAGNGMFTQAETIFAGLEAIRPESEMPLVGQAFVRICAGKAGDGAILLQKAVEKNPDSDMAMSFLGLALNMCGMGQASRNALEQVVESNANPEAVALAKSVLEEQ